MSEVVPRSQQGADVLSSVLAEAGVSNESSIRVAGKDGLAPLIWLCRHGFDHVAYVRLGQGAPREPGDVLLVLHTTTPAELEQLLNEPGQLREGGVLIVQTSHLRTPDGRDPIHAILERAGYVVESCVPRRCNELHVARRHACGPDARRAA